MTAVLPGNAITATGRADENTNRLSEKALKFFEDRGISGETVERLGIYSSETDRGEAIVFPYLEGGKPVNHKYRGPQKKFWQDTDGISCFWNSDVLAEDGIERLVITEGEMDTLSAIEAGFPHAVSVPSGAPQTVSDDPDRDDTGKFSFVFRAADRLKRIGGYILAVDDDLPGRCLAEELVRRLTPQRCWFVRYPEGCKDLNDVLQKHGVSEVSRVLDAAKPYPVGGLYQYSELPDEPEIMGLSTGIESLDGYFKPWAGGFCVLTGVPGAGKSTFVSKLLQNMASLHGWTIALASFEYHPKYAAKMLMHAYARKGWRYLKPDERERAENWVERHFVFIAQTPKDDDTDFDLDKIIETAEAAVLRHGIRCLVIDPWNELEHKRDARETETDYTNRAIRQIKRFAKATGVFVIVVAHPTKLKDGEAPTLYSISGSAHWANKCDVALIIDRTAPTSNLAIVKVRKARFRETARHGDVELQWNELTGEYIDGSGQLEAMN